MYSMPACTIAIHSRVTSAICNIFNNNNFIKV